MHSLSEASYKILCVMIHTMGHPALLSIRLTLSKLSLAGQLSREGKSVRYPVAVGHETNDTHTVKLLGQKERL